MPKAKGGGDAARFHGELLSRHMNGKHRQLTRALGYTTNVVIPYALIIVPMDFIYDGASIPRFLWSVVGHPFGKYAPAAVLHDYLYTYHKYPRRTVDKIFLEAMCVIGVKGWRRRIMYAAVRLFGHRGYKRSGGEGP